LCYTLIEVFQPQIPLGLPCYDFTSVTCFIDAANQKKQPFPPKTYELSGRENTPIFFQLLEESQFPKCDGRYVQRSETNSPRHARPRLLAIPTSCSRVAENNPNLGHLWGFAPTFILASHCNDHCSACVAQFIRAMGTCHRPSLPLGFP
jgi:hypothetical protein